MGIFKNIKEAFEVIKEKEVFEQSRITPTGFEAQAYSKDVAPVKSDYLNEMKGWTGTSVTAIADQLASIKIRLYKYTKDGSEEVVQHDVLDLLFKVNDFTTKFDHFWLTQAYLELTGEAPWFIEKKGNKIVNIFFLRPDRLRPIVGDDRLISGYKYKVGNAEEIDLKLDEVIFLKYPNPANPFRGIGTLQMAARTVDIDNYSEEWNKMFYQNSAHPDSILTVDTDQMGDDQKNELKKSLKSQYQGFKKAHQTMVLFGNMKWENIGFTQKDMDFLEQQKFSRDKILGIFRVPKAIVSQTDGVNFASAKTAENIFAKYTIDPKMERLIQQLNEFLLPQFPGTENMFLDYDSPVPTDKETDAKIWAEGLKNGYYTINEVRQELNLPEVEGGDEIYLPFNLAPLGTERGAQPKTLAYKDKNIKKKALHEDNRVQEMKARSRVFFKSKDYEEELTNKVIKGIKKELKKGIKKAEYNYWSEEKIMAFWVKKDEIARKYDPKIKEKLVKLFRDQRKKTIPKLNKYKDIKQDANSVYNSIKLNVEQEATKTVGLTINIFEDLFEEGANATFKELDLDTKIDMESEEIKKIIKADSRKMSVAINDTTNEKLKKQVIDGFVKGESIDEIAEKIKNMFVSAEEFRAQMIAKTESIRYNAGATEQAFKDSGIVAKKEWLVNPGACEYCQTMPGKTASLGESFFKEGDSVNGVDGGKLSLDYEEVEHPPLHTNCKCDLIPVLKK